MNAMEALRRADPARSTADGTIGPDEERLLRSIVAAPTGGASTAAPRPSRRDRRPVLVTAAVAVVVVTLAVVAIRLGAQAPHVASTGEASVPTVTTELREAVTNVFPEAFDGRATTTWTDASPGGQGDDPVDLTGKVPAYAAACEGGGSVSIRVTGRPDRTLDCARLTTLGPVVLDPTGVGGGMEFSVVAASGHPRYLVKLTAVEPTTTAPAIAATCSQHVLTLVADRMGGALGTDYGEIDITNRGASACTLRGWPTAYLTDRAGGARIGAPAHRVAARDGSKASTVTLAPRDGHARIDVAVVNIGGYSTGDGTYGRTCGHAVTGTGWMLTLPGSHSPVYVPFAPSGHALCSSPTLSISDVGPVLRASASP